MGRALPNPLSSLVGRDDDVVAVCDLVRDARLVTLTGAPGVGKTRLAIQAANALADTFDGRVAWVELATVSDQDGLSAAIEEAELPGDTVVTALAALAGHPEGRLLVVLDNCEHLVTSAAVLVDELLQRHPALSVLATSQEPFGIIAEHLWRVSPLGVPSPFRPSLAGNGRGANDSIRLFCDRARAVNPSFGDDDELTAVTEICRRLDGIPLAIELAAAAIAVLPAAEIVNRLEDPFEVLVWGSRTACSRHRSMESALHWSWRLLSEPEQALLRRLSVFADGVSIDAAASLCALDDGGERAEEQASERPALGLIGQLVAKSLLQAVPTPLGSRYRLFGVIRAYAHDRLLEAGEEVSAQRQATKALARIASIAEQNLYGPQHDAAVGRFELERSNCVAALEAAEVDGWTECHYDLTAALAMFWWLSGAIAEGRDWFARSLRADPPAPPPPEAKLLWGSSLLAVASADFEAAQTMLTRAMAVTEASEDARLHSRTLLLLAECTGGLGDVDSALDHLEQSIAGARSNGDAWCVVQCLAAQGWIWLWREDPRAPDALQECASVARSIGDRRTLAGALNGLGLLSSRRSDIATAKRVLEESISIARTIPAAEELPVAMTLLAVAYITHGERQRARELLEASLEKARALGSPAHIGSALGIMGSLAYIEGDAATATELFEEAASASPGGEGSWMLILGLAEASHGIGDRETARALTEEALSLARANDDARGTARVLYSIGKQLRSDGDYTQAASAHYEGLMLRMQMGNLAGVAESLEALAGVAVALQRWTYAVRVFAAAQALRDEGGYVRYPTEERPYQTDLVAVRNQLRADEFSNAWAAGSAQPLQAAIAYVGRGRGRHRQVGAAGRESLTPTELQVATMASEGLTNRAIGEGLHMSPRTVQVHLSHIFAKLGLNSRVELAKEMAGWNLL